MVQDRAILALRTPLVSLEIRSVQHAQFSGRAQHRPAHDSLSSMRDPS
jgi:hypothetical protein